MKGTGGLSRRDLIVVVAVLAVLVLLAAMVLPALRRAEDGGPPMRCRVSLKQLGQGMGVYVGQFGGERWYPCPLARGTQPDDYNGAEWLASLYWTGVVPDPAVFLCGSSWDDNDEGRDLGTHHAVPGRFGTATVSYAAQHYYSRTDAAGKPQPGAIAASLYPNPAATPMACDDTQGCINHGIAGNGMMLILFFDGHIEHRTNEQIDLERAVGQKAGLLWQLRN